METPNTALVPEESASKYGVHRIMIGVKCYKVVAAGVLPPPGPLVCQW